MEDSFQVCRVGVAYSEDVLPSCFYTFVVVAASERRLSKQTKKLAIGY